MSKFLAKKLSDKLTSEGYKAPQVEDLMEKLRYTINSFKISGDEAFEIVYREYANDKIYLKKDVYKNVKTRDNVRNTHFLEVKRDAHDDFLIDFKRGLAIQIKDINKKNSRVIIEAKVLKLWDATHKSIKQAGLLKDNSGIIKFVSFNGSFSPTLEIGKQYVFKGLVTDYYNNRFSVRIDRSTIIKESLDEKL